MSDKERKTGARAPFLRRSVRRYQERVTAIQTDHPATKGKMGETVVKTRQKADYCGNDKNGICSAVSHDPWFVKGFVWIVLRDQLI